MSLPRIVIIGNMSKPGVGEMIERLRPWFAQRAEISAVLPVTASGCECRDVRMGVVFGGDGTLLSAARLLSPAGVPLVGVNMGKLGFLAEYTVEDMQANFDAILDGKIAPTRRVMLEVCTSDCGQGAFCSPVANDVVIAAGAPFRMIDLSVELAGEHIAQYLGDGLVISTPTGSTGYSLSAGGTIIEPTIDAIAITPVAPHSLSVRPIVIDGSHTIRVVAKHVNPGTTVIVDGQVSTQLCSGQIVDVRRAEYTAKIISHPGRGFFKTLSRKLQWGLSPHHRE